MTISETFSWDTSDKCLTLRNQTRGASDRDGIEMHLCQLYLYHVLY